MLSFLSQGFVRICVIALAGFAGGAAASLLVAAKPIAAATSPEGGAAVSSYFSVFDAVNTKGIEAYVNNGYPAQNIYAADGRVRLQQGLYPKGSEAGLPLMAFSDNGGSMRMLFRLAGKNESPVIIMKDRIGKDRVVFGLNLDDANEDPFMALINKDGTKTMLFGTY